MNYNPFQEMIFSFSNITGIIFLSLFVILLLSTPFIIAQILNKKEIKK